MRIFAPLVVMAISAGCTGSRMVFTEQQDGSVETADAGEGRDAGMFADAGWPDANASDAGTRVLCPNSGEVDAGSRPDAGTIPMGFTLFFGSPAPPALSPGAGDGVLHIYPEPSSETQRYITSVTVQKTGTLRNEDVRAVYVTDCFSQFHGAAMTFGSESWTRVTFFSDPIQIPRSLPGQTYGDWSCIHVNVIMGDNAADGTMLLSLNADALTGYDDLGHALLSSGSIGGGSESRTHEVLHDVEKGAVRVTSFTTLGGTPSDPIEVAQGTADVEVARYRFEEISGYEAVYVGGFRISLQGSADPSGLENPISLFVNGEFVDTMYVYADWLTTNFPLGLPIILPNGSLEVSVRANVTMSPLAAGRTFNFTIQNDWHIGSYGQTSNLRVPILTANGEEFPIGDVGAGSNWMRLSGTPCVRQ